MDQQYSNISSNNNAENTAQNSTKRSSHGENHELRYLELYMEDLKSIPTANNDELLRLFELHAAGDESARNRLTEVYLLNAVQIAAEFRNQGIPLADLIQEANIGLVTALSEPKLTQYGELKLNDTILKEQIRHALEQAVKAEIQEQKTGEYFAAQINELNNASKDLAERHGKEPSVAELAEYLHITEDEVKSYMKMSLDAIHAQTTD